MDQAAPFFPPAMSIFCFSIVVTVSTSTIAFDYVGKLGDVFVRMRHR
jgi:hypothetical protein